MNQNDKTLLEQSLEQDINNPNSAIAMHARMLLAVVGPWHDTFFAAMEELRASREGPMTPRDAEKINEMLNGAVRCAQNLCQATTNTLVGDDPLKRAKALRRVAAAFVDFMQKDIERTLQDVQPSEAQQDSPWLH